MDPSSPKQNEPSIDPTGKIDVLVKTEMVTRKVESLLETPTTCDITSCWEVI